MSECLNHGALRQLSTGGSYNKPVFFSSSRNAFTHEPKQRVNYRFICLLFANCTVKCLDIFLLEVDWVRGKQ